LISVWLAALVIAGMAPVLVDYFRAFLERRVRSRTLLVLARAKFPVPDESGAAGNARIEGVG
jgi:hypothetical protein